MSAKLYHAANELLAVLGLHGTISMDHEAAENLLHVVTDMDGGIYNKDFGKRQRKQKPDTLPLEVQ